MITMDAVLPKTPADWAGHYRQSYWEIPAALRNSTLIGTPHYDNPDLYSWVVDNRGNALVRSTLLVGDLAESVSAGMVLDLVRQPGVYARYREAALAWADEGQVTGIWRSDAESREEREFLIRANVLIAPLPQYGAKAYTDALDKLIKAREKRTNRVAVFWADEQTYSQYRDNEVARFGDPIFVDAG
jgi:hypothetical protein